VPPAAGPAPYYTLHRGATSRVADILSKREERSWVN